MTIALIVLHVVVCLILILVILLQAGRGQGLTGPTFGSGNVDSLFGTRAADFLTKATSVAAICFLLTCIALDYLEAQKGKSLLEGPRKVAPIDLEQIKKALEKVKSEKPSEPVSAPGGETAKTTTAVATPQVSSGGSPVPATPTTTTAPLPTLATTVKDATPPKTSKT